MHKSKTVAAIRTLLQKLLWRKKSLIIPAAKYLHGQMKCRKEVLFLTSRHTKSVNILIDFIKILEIRLITIFMIQQNTVMKKEKNILF